MCKTATLGPELQVSMGPRPHLWFFAFKTVTLAPELQVSMGPSPHLWFLHAKQRLCWNSELQINSLYGSQTSPVVLFVQMRLAPEFNLHRCTCRFVHEKQRD